MGILLTGVAPSWGGTLEALESDEVQQGYTLDACIYSGISHVGLIAGGGVSLT